MSKEKLKLGIIFKFHPSWMGGIIYILNLIKTLNFLDEKDKPIIYLFYRPELKQYTERINYPYLELIEWEFPSIVMGHLKSILLQKNIFISDIIRNYKLDVIFPLQDYPVKDNSQTRLISWIADFQYKHYPEFFSNFQIIGRIRRVKLSLKHADDIVLSSHDAFKDLIYFFTIHRKPRIHIYHFVSIVDNPYKMEFRFLKEKYQLPDNFFMVSNQFHKHKNHKTLFLSLASLRDSGIIKNVAITGRFPPATESPYIAELHHIIEVNNLQDQIFILGLISREDQLGIMSHSQAVIQPSLFEGWSTVIEDAKSLQVPVIASNISVNIEQLGENAIYFNPENPDELALILKDFPFRVFNKKNYSDIKVRAKQTAAAFIKIIT